MLLIPCHVAIMSVYAYALAGYTQSYLPEPLRRTGTHLVGSAALVMLALANFIGPGRVEKSENLFNIGKLAVLAVFIVGGIVVAALAIEGFARWIDAHGRRHAAS